MTRSALSILVICALLPGCPAPEPDPAETGSPADDTAPDTAHTGETGAAPLDCGDAAGALPAGLVELSWDDGAGGALMSEQSWSVGDLALAPPVHEQVRFELEHPAKIYGFSVQYGSVAPDRAVTAGLYGDFGHNGFDMWHFEPLWQGSLCPEDVETGGEWVDFVLPEPLEADQPGLLYVGHLRADEQDAEWLFDLSYAGDGTCAIWDDCHSSANLPEEQIMEYGGVQYYYWPGLSSTLPYDFMVRLHVEYTQEIPDEERIFQPVDGVTTSSRGAWGDYDGDGWDDLLVSGPTLYRNNGDGTFADATKAAGLSGISASGGVWGDFDNDGCLDLFAFLESYSASDTLLRNQCDGTFTDVTATAGLTDVQDYNDCGGGYDRTPTPAAAWWDVDGDGLLDLYLANFICWGDYTYYADAIWRNEGGGVFADWTGTNGFAAYTEQRYASRGANPIDHDRDGDVDLWVNHYVLQRNVFYDNNNDGTVAEWANGAGLIGDRDPYGYGYYGHTIGTAWGDLDNDGDFDAIAANLAHPRFWDFSNKTEVLLNNGYGSFDDIQGDWSTPHGAAGLRFQETHSVPSLADFDNDGALDLAITAVYDGRPSDFYWGLGDGTFSLDVYSAGITTENGWGLATSDFDGDGDVDLASSDVLFENTLVEPGRWLQVRAVGDGTSNRAAIGATVELTADGQTFLRHVPGGGGQGGQDSLYLHFGLGEASQIDAIEITFPGGATTEFVGPFDADQRLWLYESGRVESSWAPPEDAPSDEPGGGGPGPD